MKLMKCTPEQEKDTGLAVVLILLIITLFSHSDKFVAPAIIALVVTMTWPPLYKPLAPLWFGLSHVMGNIVSRILLTLVFYVVVTPIGLFRKMLGFDAMRTKLWKSGTESAFTERNHTFEPKDLETPY